MSEGFEMPLHRALTEPILLAGAPRNVAIVNGTLAAALGIGMHLWLLGLLIAVAGHTDADKRLVAHTIAERVLRRHVNMA